MATRTSVEFLQSLPVITADEALLNRISDSCVVCLDQFELCNELVRLPCNHIFHRHCIFTWLSSKNTCPLCHHEMPMERPPLPYRRNVVEINVGSYRLRLVSLLPILPPPPPGYADEIVTRFTELLNSNPAGAEDEETRRQLLGRAIAMARSSIPWAPQYHL